LSKKKLSQKGSIEIKKKLIDKDDKLPIKR